VYRAFDNHIYELSMSSGASWNPVQDLSKISGAPNGQGNPHPYVRSDGISSVVFRDSVNVTPAVWEIALLTGGWAAINLTANSDFPGLGATGGDPTPYVRGDGTNAIVCRMSNDHILELALVPSSSPPWLSDDLSMIADASAAASDPMGYVHVDGTSAVVFRSRGDNHT
jgi:hypothetical protein